MPYIEFLGYVYDCKVSIKYIYIYLFFSYLHICIQRNDYTKLCVRWFLGLVVRNYTKHVDTPGSLVFRDVR